MTRPTFGDRLYRWLLRLLPSDFRGDYGYEMRADFRDQLDEARRRGRGALVRLWIRTLPGVMATAGRAWLADAEQDVRFASRLMARSPGFTAAAILMLALGTGANAAMFSVIDAVMLRSPFKDPGRVGMLRLQAAGRGPTAAYPAAQIDLLTTVPSLDAVGILTGGDHVIRHDGIPRSLNAECVSAGMFRALGTPPLLGRVFTAEEDRPGAPAVAVVSYAFWRRELGGRPDAVSQTLLINDAETAVVGVMPPRFNGALSRENVEAWLPVGPGLARPSPRGCLVRASVNVVVRVKDGWTLDRAAAQMNASALLSALRPINGAGRPQGVKVSRVELDPILGEVVYDQTALASLLGAVACVLLIACANVANLQIERVIGRRRELAVRLALGASRGRVVRQTLTENLLISLVGAAAGLVAAQWTLRSLVAIIPPGVPHKSSIAIDGRTLIATLAAALVAGAAVGIMPALHSTRPALAGDLRESTRVSAGREWPRRALVVLELALSVLLMVGAGLTIRTFLTLRPAEPGFDPRNKISASVRIRGTKVGWHAEPQNLEFLEAVTTRIRALPGVLSVAATSNLPLGTGIGLTTVDVDSTTADVWTDWITPNYFDVMAIPMVRGRAFAPADSLGAEPVAVVSRAMAKRFWNARDPLGAVVRVTSPDDTVTERRIVGIVEDTRTAGGDTRARALLFVPYAQEPGPLLDLVVTAGGPMGTLPDAIRRAVADVRPDQIVGPIESVQTIVDESVQSPRFAAWLLGLFAAMAVGLAALGLAAVIAWWVAQRTREIGVRVALGASRGQVGALIVRQALTLAVVGVALGLGLAAASTRLLQEWLYGVTPLDGRTFAGCALLMLAIAGLASYLPARRATRIDPITALRVE